MTALQVIADDVTGACDVGAELAAAGFAVRVAVDGEPGADEAGEVRVVNTQSRAVRASEAYTRVLRLARGRSIDVLLKKIDTALRGHLGAELDAALDGLGAAAAFVAPAIPAVGRVTRGGCQWFDGRPLGDTEFASDPEGGGAESSVAAVMARESRRRSELIGLETLRADGLCERARTLMRAGVDLFVLDAESDDDLATVVRSVLDLPHPLCLAGSIGVTAALANALRPAGTPVAGVPEALPGPALIVCGSLHSMASEQLDAVCGPAGVERLPLPSHLDDVFAPAVRAQLLAGARDALASGRSVALVAPRPHAAPDIRGRRAVEQTLAGLARDVVHLGVAAALVLIGGETTYGVLRAIGATELTVQGRIAPLVAVGTIGTGDASGLRLVVKGGSGGHAGTLRTVLDRDVAACRAAS